MSRTTIKQANKLIDTIKIEMGLKSRQATLAYIYGNNGPAKAFKNRGFDLSHYKDGVWSLSNYKRFGFKWFVIAPCDLFMPKLTTDTINNEKNLY
jgi:hypothetical protein